MKTKPNRYWNVKKNCHEAALLCKKRSEFAKKYSQAYTNTLKNGWQKELFSHMTSRKKWTKKECQKIAHQCSTKSEFAKKHAGPYKASRINNWLDEICRHMLPIGNIFNKMIYVWLFPDKYFYVGQTYKFSMRKSAHFSDNKSAVKQHIEKTGLQPKEIIVSNYIPVKEAIQLEIETEKKYISMGFISLNKTKPGSIGGSFRKWNKENCKKMALKCKNRREFYEKHSSAYKAARLNKWLDEICKHMGLKQKWKFYSKEKCHELALLCKTKIEFRNKYSTAYKTACKNKWINEISTHLVSTKKLKAIF